MNAVIMAGGEGTRLRPITCGIPKPLVPLCSKPVLEYILELLAKHGCSHATMTLMYLGKKIEEYFGEEPYEGITLRYSYETTPLGTAGSVKNAVRSASEPLLIISGDAMCDFDLTSAMAYHMQKGAAATLIVKKVADPREYGLVQTDSSGRIVGFAEKPPLSHCVTDLANTGIYILSPSVLDLIDSGKSVDFASDVFPQMLRQGMPIFAYEDAGYWCDIGDIISYQQCQKDMLAGRVQCRMPAENLGGIYSNTDLSQLRCHIVPPVFIGKNVVIGENTLIDSGTVIGNNVTIGKNCKIRGGILHDYSYISDMVTCNEAVVCKNGAMKLKSAAFEHAVMGEGAILGEESCLQGGIKLWNQKTTAPGITVREDIKYGFARNIIIDDDGISGETNIAITPELMTRIGASIGSLKIGSTVGIACNHTKSGVALKQALAAGIVSSGSNVFDFGEEIETEYDFCLHKSRADFGIYIESNIITNVMMTEKCGIPMMRNLERKLESAINRCEYKKSGWNDFGIMINMAGLKKLYQFSLLKEIGGDLQDMSAQVKSSNSRVCELLTDTLKKLGCGTRSGISLMISPDGKQVSAYTPETGYLFPEKVLSLICLSEFLNGKDVVIPYEAPAAIEKLAEQYGRKAYRYYSSPCDSSDEDARKMAADSVFLRDGLVMAVKLLFFLKKRRMTLAESCRLLPEFETASRLIGIRGNSAAIMRQFHSETTGIGEGISISDERGRVLIRPVKSGKGIMLYAESVRSETASELCDFYEHKIKDSEEKNGKEMQ